MWVQAAAVIMEEQWLIESIVILVLGSKGWVLNESLVEVNDKCERLWSIYSKYVMKGYAISTILMAILSIGQSMIDEGHFNADNLYRPFKIM